MKKLAIPAEFVLASADRTIRHVVPPTPMHRLQVAGLTAVGLWVALATAVQAGAQDRPITAELEQVYRLGGPSAPEWALFEDPLPVGFDAAGNLFVLNQQAGQVVIIDPKGGLTRTVGRSGRGPGELNVPHLIAVWRDGRFAVSDIGHAAYQIFAPDGELQRLVKMTPAEGRLAAIGGLSLAIRADPQGDAIVAQGVPSYLGSRLSGLIDDMVGTTDDYPSDRVDERGLERINLEAEVVSFTTVLRAWKAPRDETPERVASEALRRDRMALVGMMDVPRFFEPGFHWDLLPDGRIAYSDSSAYAVKIIGPEGRVTDVLRRPIRPERVTQRIRSAMVEHDQRHREEARNHPRVAERRERIKSLMPGVMENITKRLQDQERDFWPEVPIVRGVRATWNGGLWIQRRGAEPWEDDGPIDVFRQDRTYAGTLPARAPGMPTAFGPDGLVVFWEFDQMDGPTIVVKRLPVEVR